MEKKILFVDDEQAILNSYQRYLGFDYQIETALGGKVGLEMLKNNGPYAIVVSDMRMPKMDGTEFLAEVKKKWPNVVRMLLTGQADMLDAISVVNEGHIFRFLTKPCPPDIFSRALDDGLEMHRLLASEKELLQDTLRGSVKVLMDVVSAMNPRLYRRSARIKELASRLAKRIKFKNLWQVDLATLLSRIGYVTLPTEIVTKKLDGQALTPAEEKTYLTYVETGYSLIKNIPRLQDIAEAILYQEKCFNGEGPPNNDVSGQKIPVISRILKLIYDYDACVIEGDFGDRAYRRLLRKKAYYDPEIFSAFRIEMSFWNDEEQEEKKTKEIEVVSLKEGMVLAEDIRTKNDILLAARDQEVSVPILVKMSKAAREGEIKPKVKVVAA